MSTGIFEGFSVSHAAILDGTTGAEAASVYGVHTASIAANTGNFDNTGDDTILSTWYWIDYATLTVEGGYVPFSTIALLTTSTQVSSGSSPNDYFSLPLWEAASANVPPKPVKITLPSKDSAGTVRNMDYVLFKVQFSPISFTGPVYKSGLRLNYTGRAIMSNVDETGATLARPAIGKIVNYPANAASPL
jgi:hypothetical protein